GRQQEGRLDEVAAPVAGFRGHGGQRAQRRGRIRSGEEGVEGARQRCVGSQSEPIAALLLFFRQKSNGVLVEPAHEFCCVAGAGGGPRGGTKSFAQATRGAELLRKRSPSLESDRTYRLSREHGGPRRLLFVESETAFDDAKNAAARIVKCPPSHRLAQRKSAALFAHVAVRVRAILLGNETL